VKSDRLLSILLLLQTRGLVRATELAERLEVSVRTIYRDIEALSSAGVPVYAEQGRNGGIKLLPGYRTNVTGLTHDEARALFVMAARGTHADLGLAGALGSALRKLMAALPEPHRPAATMTSERVLIDPAGWRRSPEAAGQLTTLQAAVFTDRRLLLRYRHSDQPAPNDYTVDPYGLVSKGGIWYLVADHQRLPRLYRVSRVQAAELTESPVNRRDGVELADLWELLRRRVERRTCGVRVLARVRSDKLDMFSRVFASNLEAPARAAGPDWSEVELSFAAVMGARQLLCFGDDIEVDSPDEVRADMAATARSVLALYDR
jgi:predicted DNA-binding transcriptional regulator YafY